MSLKLGVDHRSVTRLFSNNSQGRKSSVPSAVIASAPLISATVGDGLGAQLCEFLLSFLTWLDIVYDIL
ncbi:hypothetical protein QR680_002200 [Steinernema hermaphroditum]|uniref:Uncharacterized protein n=1 Tax=Steinernema hermaphroditum TaxID=289476 RepID=A0AA39LHS3_9BILA|nr:hypothetical protein QR680_002200 [Steinernema hermaphroditum]